MTRTIDTGLDYPVFLDIFQVKALVLVTQGRVKGPGRAIQGAFL